MNSQTQPILNRRRFLAHTLLAGASASLALSPGVAAETNVTDTAELPKRKIKLGLIGCGGRGSWIGGLFKKHGGFEIHALADYFPDVAKLAGDALGVDANRCFSTLSGYKRVLESGVEAVALETPPYFFPQHAREAVASGLHVYLAKPVAVDVPGCLQIEAAAKEATRKRRCFLVDYQLPTAQANQEVKQRIGAAGFGKIVRLVTTGICGGFPDPPRTANLESRLRNLTWVNDIAMGCDYLGNYDIHAIDAALWVAGERPIAASGTSRIARPNAHGDSHDVCTVLYEYKGGMVHDHLGQALKNFSGDDLSCRVYGQTGNATLTYWGKAQLRSYDDAFNGEVTNLYEAGVMQNIARFHRDVTTGLTDNGTVRRAVDGALACVLGREAAERRQRLTMEQLIKENRKLEVDLSGLKT
jgi:predicted dehydrogenase